MVIIDQECASQLLNSNPTGFTVLNPTLLPDLVSFSRRIFDSSVLFCRCMIHFASFEPSAFPACPSGIGALLANVGALTDSCMTSLQSIVVLLQQHGTLLLTSPDHIEFPPILSVLFDGGEFFAQMKRLLIIAFQVITQHALANPTMYSATATSSGDTSLSSDVLNSALYYCKTTTLCLIELLIRTEDALNTVTQSHQNNFDKANTPHQKLTCVW
eukprot:CAMPEP_0201556678 /NCGR_PEP_ID=MMETSP0173_2-20130828/57094_1 /ASSEMBLY_ACC=CAM_ASM_000268 /TAXON_ID=218659 /ORGANISM="Vexillifera sp., Strain DIVA3 564/2" /LENGTH=214 /DNA_ID=CAMNT_0047969097 /DNA_START=106 /DNA_END=747 /DNA_ORIENTATION=-